MNPVKTGSCYWKDFLPARERLRFGQKRRSQERKKRLEGDSPLRAPPIQKKSQAVTAIVCGQAVYPSEHATLSGFRSPQRHSFYRCSPPAVLPATGLLRFHLPRSRRCTSSSRTYSKATSGTASAPPELTSLGNGSSDYQWSAEAARQPARTWKQPHHQKLGANSTLSGRSEVIPKNRSLFCPNLCSGCPEHRP